MVNRWMKQVLCKSQIIKNDVVVFGLPSVAMKPLFIVWNALSNGDMN